MRVFLQIRPVLAALRSHKTAVLLLVLEIALTMAVLGNLVFIVYGTMQRSHVPTGADESRIGLIQSIGVIGDNSNEMLATDLAALKGTPGVQDAAYGGPPLWYASTSPLFLDPERSHRATLAYEFLGSQGLSETLGVRVLEGRNLRLEELPDASQWGQIKEIPVLITRALGQQLFPNGNALGQLFYDGNTAMRVVGVIAHLRGEITGRTTDDYSVVIQYRVGMQDMGGGFMIRVRDAAQLPQVLHLAAAALQKVNPGHVQSMLSTMPELRQQYFQSDLAAGRMLVAIMLILLVVTALGVSGLASFWVQQRRRQIGMHRALGAMRGDILHYFQAENFLIVSAGVLLGALSAYALNLFLMRRFEIAHLPASYLAVSAVVLWLLGQLAVLGPALRAASVPPVVATRAV